MVVLLSDHGHVLDHGSGRQRSNGGQGGERWRASSSPPEEGEILVEGPRVLAPSDRCVMAWDERIRYGPRKHGYHGGASAQEVLAPVLVLVPTLVENLAGWVEAPYDPPAWWTGVVQAQPLVGRKPRPGEQLGLQPRSWIAALLSSETFAAQRALATGTPLSDELLMTTLTALDELDGRMLRPALAQAAGIAPGRLPGLMAALRLLLNVDGYAVVNVDEDADTVALDVALLPEQFGLWE